MICTIYKSGPKYDSSNCHGVTLTSCLGKLFSTLSHVKIENELEKKKILSQSQAGFRKKYGRAGHMLCVFDFGIKEFILIGRLLRVEI